MGVNIGRAYFSDVKVTKMVGPYIFETQTIFAQQ